MNFDSPKNLESKQLIRKGTTNSEPSGISRIKARDQKLPYVSYEVIVKGHLSQVRIYKKDGRMQFPMGLPSGVTREDVKKLFPKA